MRGRNPLVRLFGIILLVAVAMCLGFTLLHWAGEQDTIVPNPHPWMKLKFWNVARLDSAHCTSADLDELLGIDPDWFIWLDVTMDKTEKWSVICPRTKVFGMDKDSVAGPDLSEVLPKLLSRGVLLNVHALDGSYAEGLIKALGDWPEKKTDVGIASPSQSLVRELRKREPQWLFAGDSATWTKLKFFESLNLERLTDLWADFYLTSLDPNDPNLYSIGAAREIARREKVLLLVLEASKPEMDFQARRTIRGILTTRPKTFSADAFLRKGVAE